MQGLHFRVEGLFRVHLSAHQFLKRGLSQGPQGIHGNQRGVGPSLEILQEPIFSNTHTTGSLHRI